MHRRSDRRRLDKGPLAGLSRPIFLTRVSLIVDRGLRAFWPFLSVLAVVFTAFSFGFGGGFSLPWLVLWVIVIAAALVAALWFGLRQFRWPTRADAVAHLDATLPGRPLAALSDGLALGGNDPAASKLWQAHLRRMMMAAQGARAVCPDPDLATRDPYALRLVALTAAVVAVIFGTPLALWRSDHGVPPSGAAIAAMGPSWEGWAEPPRYTGKPGLYLNRVEGDEIVIPEGTRVLFRFYGDPSAIPFEESVSNPAASGDTTSGDTTSGDTVAPASGPQQRQFIALQSGAITVGGPAGRMFNVVVMTDDAPSVRLTGQAERRADGKFAQSFEAIDDHAVVSGQARIQLDLAAVSRNFGLKVDPEPRPDLVFDLPMPISGSRAAFTETLVEDAEKHPWANLPVTLQLSVEDGRGQTGMSAPEEITLPGRRFFDPRAAALIELRRDLLWSSANAKTDAELLRAITHRPEGYFPKPEMAMTLRLAALRLEQNDLTSAARDDIAEMLWGMAELLEDGGLSDALAAMQQAQERLSEAMRNGASKDEIAKLMQDLKDATDNYLRMLAERAQQQDQTDQPDGGSGMQGQQVTGDQIQQLMDEIQRLMEEGRMAEAQQLLEQLSRLMQNLQVQQGQSGQGGGPGNQAMRDLGDTLRQQQDLSDDAFRGMQQGQQGEQPGQQPGEGQHPGQGGQGQEGQGQQDQGQNGAQGGQGAEPGQSLAERQRALRRELDRQRGLMPRLEGEAGDAARRNLEQAGRAMEGAERALREGDNGGAIDRQAEAIEALREGMRDMREALSQGQQGGQPGQQDGPQGQDGQRNGDATGGRAGRDLPRDPLGRVTGDGGQSGSNENMLQGDDPFGRARELLDELRRRSADRSRSDAELDYLKRLLDPF